MGSTNSHTELSFGAFMEVFLGSVLAGITWESWYVGGGAFLAILVASLVPFLRLPLGILFAVLWGILAAAAVKVFPYALLGSFVIFFEIEKHLENPEVFLFWLFESPAAQVIGGIVVLLRLAAIVKG